MNYLVVYPGSSQVYGAASKGVALSSPPPEGFTLADKRVYFIANEPDNQRLVWYRIPDDEVQSAEIAEKKKKEKKT